MPALVRIGPGDSPACRTHGIGAKGVGSIPSPFHILHSKFYILLLHDILQNTLIPLKLEEHHEDPGQFLWVMTDKGTRRGDLVFLASYGFLGAQDISPDHPIRSFPVIYKGYQKSISFIFLKECRSRLPDIVGHIVNPVSSNIAIDDTDIILQSKEIRLTPTADEVTIVHDFGLGFPQGLGDAWDQEIRDDSTVVIAGTDHDEVGFEDLLHRQGVRFRNRFKKNFFDSHFFKLRTYVNLILSRKDITILEGHKEAYIREGHWYYCPPHIEYLGCFSDTMTKVARDFLKGRKKDIAETVSLEASFGKAVIHKLPEHVRGIGEGHQALTDISRREDTEFITKDTSRATIVGHRDDSRELNRIFLESRKKRETPRPSSDGHYLNHGVFTLQRNVGALGIPACRQTGNRD